MSPRHKTSLISQVEHGKFKHAVLTTYGLDIPFFESSIMRHLLRNGCRNAIVFADGRHLHMELARLAEPGHPHTWWFGKHYSLVPVHHRAAFHPKISLLIGDVIELYVSSANLQPGGLANNRELYHRLSCSSRAPESTHDADTVKGVWLYIRHSLSRRIPTCVQRQLLRIETDVPWLREPATSGAHLVLAPGADAVQALADAIGNSRVNELYVVSPFFDAKLNALDRTIRKLRPRKTILLLQRDSVSIPGDHLAPYKNLEAYNIDCDEYLHAKAVVAECANKSVVLAGSHNVSAPAFDGMNFEASLIRTSDVPFSKLLKLTDHVTDKNRIDLDAENLRLRTKEKNSTNEPRSWLAAAQLDGKSLEVLTRKRFARQCKLVPFRTSGSLEPLTGSPQIVGPNLRFEIASEVPTSAWVAVAVLDSEGQSAPVPLLHVVALESRARSDKELEVGRQIKQLRTDITCLPDLLSNVASLVMSVAAENQDRQPRKRVPRRSSGSQPAVRNIPYEDFLVPWMPKAAHPHHAPARRSNLEIVVAAISRAIEGKEIQNDEFPESQDIGESLAESSLYEEEELAGATLETNPEALPMAGGTKAAAKPVPPPTPDEEKRAALQRAHGKLRSFAARFPVFLAEAAAEHTLPLGIFENLSAVSTLMMQFLARRVAVGRTAVELFDLPTWIKFNVDLFGVLASSQTRFLEKFDWKALNPELHRPVLERFLGYVAIVERICHLEAVEPEDAARILIGLVRVSRLLGVGHEKFDADSIVEAAHTYLQVLVPDAIPPVTIQWIQFVQSIARITLLDNRLRLAHKNAASIAERNRKALPHITIGDWVWWPHADGHFGVVLALDESNATIAYEPNATKLISRPYLLRIEQFPPGPHTRRASARA